MKKFSIRFAAREARDGGFERERGESSREDERVESLRGTRERWGRVLVKEAKEEEESRGRWTRDARERGRNTS